MFMILFILYFYYTFVVACTEPPWDYVAWIFIRGGAGMT